MLTRSFRGRLLNGARASAGLLLLSVLTAAAFPETAPGKTPPLQVARLRTLDGPEIGPAPGELLAAPEEASRGPVPGLDALSGGLTGSLLVGAALLSAIALLLAVVVPWRLPLKRRAA